MAGLNLAGGSEGEAQGSASGGETPKTVTVRREYPELVTLEPAGDDGEVFGEAWELVKEWRGLKDSHPNNGKSLDWLLTEERFVSVELELLEDHGLTLPPARFPLRGFDPFRPRSTGAARHWRTPGARSEGGSCWLGRGAS